jgi:putative ABC transport system permease protein
MMRALIQVWRRLRGWHRRAQLDDRLDAELRFHIDQQTQKNLEAGMTPDEARRQALVRLGGAEQTRERARDEFRVPLFENLARDMRYGARALRRAPTFTLVAVLTLALGIGATTAMFSIVDGVLLRPLPYPEQERLVEIVHEAPGMGVAELLASPAVYFGYREHSRTFDGIGYWDWDGSPATVTGGTEPESVPSLAVTHELLPLLGAVPSRGRTFTGADDEPGAAPVAVISHSYWQARFGGGDAVGQTLVVNGVSRQIVGVLPASFRFIGDSADILYPMQPVRAGARFPVGDGRAIARLRAGTTLADANADVARMIPILAQEFGTNPALLEGLRLKPTLRSLRERVIGTLDETLWLLMGTIVVLLFVACANVANLVLARTQARRAELVLRSALGAGWSAVARVVAVETVMIGVIGGLAGVAVAYYSLPVLVSLGADDLPEIMAITVNGRVLLAASLIALMATALFGVVPLAQLAWRDSQLTSTLQGGGRSLIGAPGTHTRHALVVAQVALALVLLIGAGLMIRTFQTLRRVDPGFRDPEAIQVFQLSLPRPPATGTGAANASDAEQARERALRKLQALVEQVRSAPGVQAAGLVGSQDGLPMDGDGSQASLVPIVDGRAAADGLTRLWELQRVSPGFFETMRTRVVAGRTIDWNDILNNRQVMMVSENLARKEFGSARAALGHRIGATDEGSEIVGVVQDVHHNGVNQEPPPTVMVPLTPTRAVSFVVRSEQAGTPTLVNALSEAVWAVDGNLSLSNVQTLGDMYDESMARTSMTLILLAITGAMALILGLVGVYGIVSYAVTQRRREIGVRLALGAAHGDVRRMFVGHALVLVTIGVAIGLAASMAVTRLMQSQLFGVSPLDAVTHATVALGMAVAAAGASYMSTHRASSFDAVEVLRAD